MLTRIHDHLVNNALLLIPMLVIFTMTACEDGVTTPEEMESKFRVQGVKNLKGEDYFNGVFFGRGAVADAIPEIRDVYSMSTGGLSDEDLAAAEADQDRLVQLMKDRDPTFFDRFESAVESGDQVAITSAIDEGSALATLSFLDTPEGRAAFDDAQTPENITEITAQFNAQQSTKQLTESEVEAILSDVDEWSKSDGAAANASANKLCLVLAIVVLAVLLLALLIGIVVGLAVWLAIWLWTYFWSALSANQSYTELQVEQMIGSLADTYGGGGITPVEPVFELR